MIAALVQGTLASDPQQRTTRTGNPYWTANLRVPAGDEAIFVGLSSFSEDAGARLVQLHKGAEIAAVGTLEATTWTDKTGSERKGWRLTASEILTVYAAAKRRRAAHGGGDE